MLVSAKEMLDKAKAGHYAVGQFNINNLEWTKAVLQTAQELNSPVILGVSEGAGKYMCGYKTVVGMVNGMLEEMNITVPVALHLDHGTYEGCYKCIKAGFSSIMFDGSHYPIAENVEKTTELVKAAHEKGVSIAVLTLDSEPVNQSTGKQKIFTTLAIRLVLDRAATTQEAVDLLNSYDMFATSGRDYHFFVVDASGDGRVLEYDPEQEGRPLRWTAMPAITNFYGCYAYLVKPNQRNGIYGHGKERYDAIMDVLAIRDPDGNIPADTAWRALQASAQDPNPVDVTSNTQWSLVYDDTALTAQIALRRHWDDVLYYDLNTNTIGG